MSRDGSRVGPVLLAIAAVVLVELDVLAPGAAIELAALTVLVAVAGGFVVRAWRGAPSRGSAPAGQAVGSTARAVGVVRREVEDAARDAAGLRHTLARRLRPLAEARLAARGVTDLDDPRAVTLLGEDLHDVLAGPTPRGSARRDPGWELDRVAAMVARLEALDARGVPGGREGEGS